MVFLDNPHFQAAATTFGQTTTDLNGLFQKKPVEHFHPGETIFFEGDPARHVFEILEGVVRLCRILVDGRRIITGFLFAGDMVGMSQIYQFIYSAEAVTAVRACRIQRRSLDDAVDRSSKLRPHILARICGEIAAVQEQMVLLSCKNAEERVCTFLIFLMKHQGLTSTSPVVLDLPMTRQDIADYLGMSIETVSRNLTRLTKKGILTDVERFSLCIVKPKALIRIANIWYDDQIEDHPAYAARY